MLPAFESGGVSSLKACSFLGRVAPTRRYHIRFGFRALVRHADHTWELQNADGLSAERMQRDLRVPPSGEPRTSQSRLQTALRAAYPVEASLRTRAAIGGIGHDGDVATRGADRRD